MELDKGTIAGSEMAHEIQKDRFSANELDEKIRKLTNGERISAGRTVLPQANGQGAQDTLIVLAEIKRQTPGDDIRELANEYLEKSITNRGMSEVSSGELAAANLLSAGSKILMREFGKWANSSTDDEKGRAILGLHRLLRNYKRNYGRQDQANVVNTIGFLANRMKGQDSIKALTDGILDSSFADEREFAQDKKGDAYYRAGEFHAIAKVASRVDD